MIIPDTSKIEIEIRDLVITARNHERQKVLDELWEFCLMNGTKESDNLVGTPNDPFFPLKLIKKIAEMRNRGDLK
jgi:hypothetical protein